MFCICVFLLIFGNVIFSIEDEFKLRYKIGSYLGDGASSTVQTAINQTSGEEVAIKTVAAK